jgi:hypothetical protein
VSDAEQVEMAFQAKLATFGDSVREAATPPKAPKLLNKPRSAEPINPLRSKIDKSVLAVPEPRGIRDRGKPGRSGARPAMNSPFLCVEGHHREAHRSGDEAAWWKKTGIDPTIGARVLWLASHPKNHRRG